MRLTALIGAFGLTAMFGAGAEAQSLACGGEYIIKRGDTLQKVTRMAYGEGLSWRFIYKANKAVVGPNPSAIEVGMRIKVPCRRGQTPGATAQATKPETTASDTATTSSAASTAAAAAPATPATPAVTKASLPLNVPGIATPGSSTYRFVTGSDWRPFQDQELENGGMITEIVDTAMETQRGPDGHKIDFINDYSAHLQTLIADIAYDFSFAWFRPNCDKMEKLGAESQFRCTSLDWSDPLFEQIIGYYMRADEANVPATHADLLGRSICRPKGYALFMMEEFDLVEPAIVLKRPVNTADCFEMLAAGEVDVVVLATMVADSAIAAGGMADQIAEQPQLSTVATLHAVTSINNPNKDAQLAVLNEGIRDVRESGAWFEIVQRHLIDHSKRTASN